VEAILLASDIPGENQMGPIIHDELCLASDKVTFIGQAIALIAAHNEEAAHEAEKKIVIELEELPAIVTLQQAMLEGELIAPERKIERGDLATAMAKSPFTLQGILRTGAQEHWYLETQSALAVPGEGVEIKVFASSQNPAETQAIVAEVLGISKNEVEVEVRRIGGGFGGKETQGNHVAAWAALLAWHTGRPVGIRLFRDDDQIMTGKRHPFISEYEIGFSEEGEILAYRVVLNSDAGAATDLSRAILERAMLHADNAYYLPAVSITGRAWKTNLPSNTAFRGFGGPQGMAVIEYAIDRMARFLEVDPMEIRFRNFYQPFEKNYTPYGQKVEQNHLFLMQDQLFASSGYEIRLEKIRLYNQQHEFTKRGIAMTPVKFGISFTSSFLNQAGALVNCYTDGTILVNHGGTEMGQGLHTKIRNIASSCFGVDHDHVKVNATNTSKVPNTSPTAASSGSDLNGMAVKNAIDTIKARLAPLILDLLKEKLPGIPIKEESVRYKDNMVFSTVDPAQGIPFSEICLQARLQQISLSATGYYRTPGIWFDRDAGHGKPFYYFAFGMAVSEVEVDLLTGNSRLLRADILQDVGDSLNPEIDKGQIIGGFVQGLGWCTMEEVKRDGRGRLLTCSPDTYKIPAIGDLPADFRVALLEDVPIEGTIFKSKAVGEPPFMLALSVWLAIRDALGQHDLPGLDENFKLPATPEVILQSLKKIR
jgi:xanthine dehydrogenase molybdopterin binding subunit